MNPMRSAVRRGNSFQLYGNFTVKRPFALLCVWAGVVGCGVAEESAAFGPERLAARKAAVATGEEMNAMGLSTNGLSTNGLSTNGLSTNGLSTNGLSTNGLQSASFEGWFEEDPAERAMVMKYIVLCAVPEGQTRTYTSPVSSQTYTWHGLLGLAPGWSQGSQPTEAEEQIITACLAAHANKYGVHVYLSVLGRSALDVEIPYTPEELQAYSETEACFFGNTFNDEGIFAAADGLLLSSSESTPRACGLSSQSPGSECPPIVHVGACESYCTLDSTGTYYTQCTYNGKAYRPISVRIRPADIYKCGDGVCQFTESCGTGNTYDSCNADCGAC